MELILLGHIIGDFYVQTDKIAEKKKVLIVYCKIKVPKVAEQKWTLLQVHFGHNCKALYHDSMERCCA